MADSANVADIKESTPVVEKEVEKTEAEAVPAVEKNGGDATTEAVAAEAAEEKKNGTAEAAATEEAATENGSAAKENGSNGDAVAENGVSEEAAEPAAGDACCLKRKSEVGVESADASETCEKKQKVDAAAEEPAVAAEANGVC